METGLRYKESQKVDESVTARAAGSGTLEVFATPAMIALIEKTCFTAVAPYLEEGQTTVGTKVDVEHVSATPVGMEVTAECTLDEIDGRRLTFQVEVFDECGMIGRGIHERFIVNAEKFVSKTYSKLNK